MQKRDHITGRFFKGGGHWRPSSPIRDKSYLLEQYYALKKSADIIASEHGVTSGSILRWMKIHQIPRRTGSESSKLRKQKPGIKLNAEERASYQLIRYLSLPEIKIKHILRARIADVLRYKNKSASTLKLLGCSAESFRIYIESKFEPGMTWENHGHGEGKWHLDHIMPCAIFDLTRPEHQRRCFHFSNYQPLWSRENLQKRDKVRTNQFNLL